MSSALLARPAARPAAPAAPRRFLPEVQALRALAVTLVVVYHVYPAAAPGGFVGVDVFFVISGFLITSHLLREVAATGRVSLPGFWAARIRRIMPAAVVTVAAVVIATLVWWPPSQWGEVSRHAVASLLSVENWVLAADAVDYLAQDAAPTALQHFWSLGVEEQFYVVWPLIVLLAAAVAVPLRRATRRVAAGPRDAPSRPRSIRLPAAVLFALVLLVSLAFSILLVRRGDPAAYFVTTARVWELAAGGLLAALLPPAGRPAPAWARSLVALGGVAILVWVAVSYTDATPFPGYGAILPVIGTLAIIAAGRTSGPGSLHRLTDLRPVQWVGDVSYSLYLWHWPLVMLAAQLLARRLHWWEAIGLVILSLVLAGLSHRFVETPARRWRPIAARPWRAVAAGAAVTAIAIGVAWVPDARAASIEHAQTIAAQALRDSPPAGFGAAAWDTDGGAAFVAGDAIVPLPSQADRDTPAWRSCVAGAYADEVRPCTFGDPHGGVEVTLVGDSHAAQWIGVLDRIGRERHWRITMYARNSCPFSLVRRTFERARHTSCTATVEETLRAIESDRPDVVVITSWSGSTYVSDPRPGFAEEYTRMRAAGIEPVVLRDTPWGLAGGGVFVRDCVAAHPTDPHRCDLARSAAAHTDGAEDAARAAGVAVIDPTPWFCDEATCPAVVGNVLVWKDQNHISNTYLLTLRPKLEHALDAIVAGQRAKAGDSGATAG